MNRSKFTEKEASNVQRTKFKTYGMGYKYNIVWIPKCRRKVLYGEIREQLGEVFHDLAKQKESKILEGHMMPNHPKKSVK